MIRELRDSVTRLLTEQQIVPVWPFIPDDVAELPCLVVGPVEVEPGAVSTTWDLDLNVYLLGRRYADEDSQLELDEMADRLLAVLLEQKNPALQRLYPPSPITVAGNPVPAYIATLRATQTGPC